jgi:transposase InsO family protein
MTAGEFTQGLNRIGIIHDTTLAYSPYQNAKIESFWGSVEGRLMAMLQNKRDLTLTELNQYSQAWVEMEYNKREHSEIKNLPLNRFLNDKNVLRPCPDPNELKQLFRCDVGRRQRHSDGTVSIESKRFEVPSQYRH